MAKTSQLPVRLPDDLKRWIEEQARLNGSSQNSEVIRALRERAARLSEGARASA